MKQLEPYRYYCDLINEIALLRYQLDVCIRERQDWSFYGRLGGKVRMDQAAERLDKLAGQIEWLSEQLEKKKKYQKHIEHKLSEFKAIEYKVAYGRVVENKTLEEIAEETGYSLSWVKQTSAKINDRLKRVYF